MNKYKLGKDMGKLMARVNQLEQKKYPCNCHEKTATGATGISDGELLESLRNAAPDDKVFEILSRLVIDAGHITIRDLFSKTKQDVGTRIATAIRNAKSIGFLNLSNDKCCTEVDDAFTDDYCKTQNDKWCSLVKAATKFRCTLASDDC
jgi:ribosomal protein S18